MRTSLISSLDHNYQLTLFTIKIDIGLLRIFNQGVIPKGKFLNFCWNWNHSLDVLRA